MSSNQILRQVINTAMMNFDALPAMRGRPLQDAAS